MKNIRNLAEYKNSENIMLFYPMKYEINLLGLLDDDKNFFFPKVDGSNLQVCPTTPDRKFVKSQMKIYEPCSNPVDKNCLDLIIVPALAVDKDKFRLGYGGGFYDKFLKEISPKTKTIVPIYHEFIIDELPRDEFDVPVDIITTDIS